MAIEHKEILKKTPEQLLEHIRGSSTGSTQQEKEADRMMYLGALNIKLSKQTEILNRRIFWLNVILVVLILILVWLTYILAYPSKQIVH